MATDFRIEIDFDLSRLNKLIGNLDFKPFEEEFKRAAQESLEEGKKAAQKAARPHTVDTGSVANSIKATLGGTGSPLGGMLSTSHPGAQAIDQGRNPGRYPPSSAVQGWANRHGFRGNVFLLVRAIGRKGTKGLKFMDAGYQAIQDSAAKKFSDAIDRISSRW